MILSIVYFVFHTVVVAIAFTASSIYRPFTFVDNDHSYVLCHQSNTKYETSPNLIFAVDEKLDPFNDKKARKLCQYQIIKDYGDTYATPGQINYTFLPALRQESSWLQAAFAFFIVYVFGSVVISLIFKPMTKNNSLLKNLDMRNFLKEFIE